MSLLPVRPGLAMSGMACLLLGGRTTLVAAQEDKKATSITWEVGTPKAGWCLQFLMEPKAAADGLARDYRLVLAREATGLPPAITHLISDEPMYADWAPAEVCTYIAEAISVDGRRFDRGDGGQPIAALYWGVAAANSGASSSDLGGVSLRVLGTNSSSLRRAMEVKSVPIDRIQIEVRPVKESADEELFLKLEGATIIYIGQPRADTTSDPTGQTKTAAYMGNNRTRWDVSFSFTPTGVAGMSGALRILGKRGLAGALDHSPIRLLSPMISGGRGTVSFTR
jgi:hypothetical protein